MTRLSMEMCAVLVVLAGTVRAQVTQRVSVSSAGAQGNAESYEPSISADGRYVAFTSWASNLISGVDMTVASDILVRDRQTGTLERVNVTSSGVQGNLTSIRPSISADGRYVVFESNASNLDPGDTTHGDDIFIHDRQNGTTECVSVDANGLAGNGDSRGPVISAGGRYVVFHSFATTLVPFDTNGTMDVFLRDRQTGMTEIVSINSSGVQGTSPSYDAAISADGRFVTFLCYDSNFDPGDTNLEEDVYVRDRLNGTTVRVSLDSNGVQANDGSFNPSISGDGRYVAFGSSATNLVPGDTNAFPDIFVRDRQSGTTERVSVATGGAQANDRSANPSISADGRYVVFASFAGNFVGGDANGPWDIYVHDRQSGTTERVSLASSGVGGNDNSGMASISADGRFIAYESDASNLVPGDTNDDRDAFVHDREHEGFPSLCEPGVSGVIQCPCANPPSVSGRGCNNSVATGGASLSVSGGEYLSSDSLVFTTGGGRATALTILFQGTSALPAGVIYGQGVRCVGGSLKRLYARTASGGSITVPNFGGGDPTVHERSTALGDAILAGSTRWYMAFYRDPFVLGGCPASSTFNTTQTREVSWLP